MERFKQLFSRYGSNASIRILDDLVESIIASMEPEARMRFSQAISRADLSKKGLEDLLYDNFVPTSLTCVDSRLVSMEILPNSPQSVSETVPTASPRSIDVAQRREQDSLSPLREPYSNPSTDKRTQYTVHKKNCPDAGTSSARQRRQITIKHYSDATPSMHCHICCRSSKNIKVYACAKIKEAICRKVVCVRCFIDNGWEYSEGWQCSHCRGICPARSQCFTYGRSNLRRKLQASKKRIKKARKPIASVPPSSDMQRRDKAFEKD